MSLDYDDEDRLDCIEVINLQGQIYVEGLQVVGLTPHQFIEGMAARGHDVIGPVVGIYAIPELGLRTGDTYDPRTQGTVIDGITLYEEETDPDFLG
ncbi:hypothetical protein [Glycomyces buryatensis]|uniref:Uncharacterized protein n=1 Tax=Glycomyces buryatensis TaxID=2570927 RepID=A0A4S8QHG2_9ACTN|nr:hypothetical protein [Glycomyces buryatensis]THV40124.1 hypothetical protein FAB82_16235 [Glycomyces buryatensis]